MRAKLVFGMIFILIAASVCIAVGSNVWTSEGGEIDYSTLKPKGMLADNNSLW